MAIECVAHWIHRDESVFSDLPCYAKIPLNDCSPSTPPMPHALDGGENIGFTLL